MTAPTKNGSQGSALRTPLIIRTAFRATWLSLLPLMLSLPIASWAQAYPTKPITLVVPFAAGGPTDKIARDLAEALRRQIPGSSFVIDNTPGAGGTNGIGKVAHANSDGYTLLVTHISIATTPWLYKNLKFNARDDFEYLGLITEVPMTLIGRTSLPARDFNELIQWMQTHKKRVNLAHAGPGSASHLCGLLLQQRLGIEITTIPFSGTGPAMAAMLSDQVDLMCDQATNTFSQIENGTVKAFGITTEDRLTNSPALSKLPTLDESGLEGFNITIWHGLYAPKGTPPAITHQLNQAIKGVLADPLFIRAHAAVGAVSVQDHRSSGAAHKKFVEAETARWGKLIKSSGQIRIE